MGSFYSGLTYLYLVSGVEPFQAKENTPTK